MLLPQQGQLGDSPDGLLRAGFGLRCSYPEGPSTWTSKMQTWKWTRGPKKTTILYIGPSMSFHVNLGEGNCQRTHYFGHFRGPGIQISWYMAPLTIAGIVFGKDYLYIWAPGLWDRVKRSPLFRRRPRIYWRLGSVRLQRSPSEGAPINRIKAFKGCTSMGFYIMTPILGAFYGIHAFLACQIAHMALGFAGFQI